MDTNVKDCPSCKKQIQADAGFCPYCGSRFSVSFQGYCANCHSIRDLDVSNRCSICGGEVYDRQPRSQFLGPPQAHPHPLKDAIIDPPPVVDDTRKQAKAANKPGSTGCVGCARTGLALILVAIGIIAAAYYLIPDFREQIRGLEKEQVAPAATLAAKALASGESDPDTSSTVQPTPTRKRLPTSTPQINLPAISPDAVCAGTYGYGINCLDNSGWTVVSQIELPYTGRLNDMTTCGDRVLLIVSDHLYEYAGGVWKHHGQYGGVSNFLACGANGGIWVLGYSSAHYYDGTTWTDYTYETVFSEKISFTLQGAAASPDGQVWAASSDHVIHFNGEKWTLYEKQKDLNADYSLTGIAVDSHGTPWVTNTRGISTFNGKTWTTIAPPASSDVNTIYVDSQDRVWVGTDGGVSMYLNGNWQRYPINKAGGSVISLTMDDQDRMWVGTDWGLGVLIKGQYTFYHMADSGLTMNNIHYLFTRGGGPVLPGLENKEPGSMKGRLVDGSNPLARARVEVCVQNIAMFFSGNTPCSDQPFLASATTDADGYFAFDNLPTAFYTVTFQVPDGKWKVRSKTLSIGSVQVLVYPGEDVNLGEMDISD